MDICGDLADRGILQNKGASHWQHYDRELPALWPRVRSILEIGVFQGASLCALAEYFPSARVEGIDVADSLTDAFRGWWAEHAERVAISCHAGVPEEPTPEFLARVDSMGVYDLIIDDAAHTYRVSRTAFDALFLDHLAPGGVYVIEDWGTTYWPWWQDGSADGRKGMWNLVPYLVDALAKPEPRIQDRIERIGVYPWQIWVWKKGGA
jgi:spermidine synthase